MNSEQGNTSYEQSTLPFGTALTAESSGFSNQVFTSYDRSAGTGLDYAVNRNYSSGQGRFTTVDPIGAASASLTNPQSNNLYAYVQNNPIDFTDPSGLEKYHPDFISWLGDRPHDPDEDLAQLSEQWFLGLIEDNDCHNLVEVFMGMGTDDGLHTQLYLGRLTLILAGFYHSLEDGGRNVPITGFRDELVGGGQRGHVYRHVFGHAAGWLIGNDLVIPGGFVVNSQVLENETGIQMIDRQLANDIRELEAAQRAGNQIRAREVEREIAGDIAGRQIGALVEMLFKNTISARPDRDLVNAARNQMREILCDPEPEQARPRPVS